MSKLGADRREYLRQWWQANRAAARAKRAAWCAANPDYNKKYYQKNAKALNVKTAAWRVANAEHIKAYSKATYQANAEQMRAKSAAWHKANPQKSRAASAKFRAAYPNYGKEKYRENAVQLRAKKAQWRKANRSLVNAKTAQRRAAKLRATPSWSEHREIRDVYLEAVYFGMNVDHVVPLIHPLVCGLHVWANLQLLTRKENTAKGNKFDPDTFINI